jgi:PKD repeat protein/subtilisin-like proprotein convertase family protein
MAGITTIRQEVGMMSGKRWHPWVAVALVIAMAAFGIVAFAQDTRDEAKKDSGEPGESAVVPNFSTTNTSDQSFAVYTYSNLVPVAIPDTGCGTYTTSVINVPDTYYVGSVTVSVCITHPWRGDLRLYLLGPDGTQVPLISTSVGSSADNLNVTFDDSSANLPDATTHALPPCSYAYTWKPQGTLGNFRFRPVAGNWTLQVCDNGAPDAGTLNQWTLTFNDLAPGVYFTPTSQTGFACPGNQISYSYTVTNFTGATTAINLGYASAWTASGPAATASLAQGASETITVLVKVSPAAPPLTTDTCTITGTAGALSGTATAVSNALMFGGWQDFADLPTPTTRGVRWHGLVYDAGKLYKIGGYNTSGAAVRPYLDIYDIATNAWTTGTDMAGNRTGIDPVVIAGKIYVAGGGTASGGTAQTTMYIYDIATNTWSTDAVPLPAARMDYAGVAIGTKYYLIGGYNGTTYLNTVVSYDTATSTWDLTIPNMAIARRWGSATAIGGKIYVAGGFSTSTLGTLTTQVYDPATNTWAAFASLPASLLGLATPITGWINAADGVLQNRYMIMAGGYLAASTASVFTLLYDSVTDTWGPALPYMTHTLYGSAGAWDGTNFWVVSGRQGDPSFHDGERTTRLNYCAAPAPVLNYDHNTFTDSCITVPAGNNDGVVDPGEAITMNVFLKNTGSAPATGISAVLSSTTPGITITTNSANFPDLTDFPPATGGSLTSYAYTVDISVPCGTSIQFSLAVTTAQGAFTVPFTQLVGAFNPPVNIFTEAFDTATTVIPAIPTDWATTVVTPGITAPTWTTGTVTVHPAGVAPNTLPNLAIFNSYTCSTGSQMRLYRSAAVNLSTYAAASLSFQMYHDTGYTNLDRIQVQASTDGGTTWVNVGASVNRYLGAGIVGWQSHTIDFAAYAGNPSVMIGFLATGAFGNDCYIDSISLDGQTALCHYCAACVFTCTGTAAPTLGLAPLDVVFAGTVTPVGDCGTATWAWDFGDATSDTIQNPTHSYAAAGDYNWTMTATMSGIPCTATGTVQVCDLSCTATATPVGTTIPMTVNFTSGYTLSPNCAGAATYAWDFGDGATDTVANPTHVYTVAGAYTWSLTITVNGLTCTQTGTIAAQPFDLTFYDDYSRSQLCVNSTTGNFAYTILRGFGIGTYTGTGVITRFNGTMTLQTPAGLPYSLTCKYLERYHKATASYTNRPARIQSTLMDYNTMNNPPVCDM